MVKVSEKKAKRQGLDFRYIFVPEYHTGKGGNSGDTLAWVTGVFAKTNR